MLVKHSYLNRIEHFMNRCWVYGYMGQSGYLLNIWPTSLRTGFDTCVEPSPPVRIWSAQPEGRKIPDLRSENFPVSYHPATGRRRLFDSFLVSDQTGRTHRRIRDNERPGSWKTGEGRRGTGTQGRGAGARVFPTSQL